MTATPADTKAKPQLKIRWMIRCDMEEVLDIERLCFDSPWSEGDFVAALRQRNCIGMVAEVGEKKNRQILGYMLYESYKNSIDLTNLAVESSTWRRGVGRALIENLIAKLSPRRRRQVTTMVRESNTGGQEFFAALGFKAISVMRRPYDEISEDAIHFRFLREERRAGGK